MCVYCNIGDSFFRHDPPWKLDPWPGSVPKPLPNVPVNPWPIDKLKDYLDMLKQVKELEDKIGCPCVPNKADYIGMFEKRIKALEDEKRKRAARKRPITRRKKK